MMFQRTSVLALTFFCSSAFAQNAWIDDARKVATSVPPKLLKVLSAEIERGGPVGAIAVCKEEAPKLARAASQETGWAIRRVSLRERNPKAVPDAWERAALEDFDRRAAAGENPSKLELATEVEKDGKRTMRYIRALPVAEVCTQCHGTSDKVSPEVRARLSELYPHDKGVGYSVGQIRGAMTISRPVP